MMNEPFNPSQETSGAAQGAAHSLGETAHAAGERVQQQAAEMWESAKTRSIEMLDRQREFMQKNPGAALLEGIAIGFVLGVLVRHAFAAGEREIDYDHKPTLDDTKYHLGALVMPFMWPILKKMRESARGSTEKLHSFYSKAKDLGAEKMNESVDRVEDWVEEEATPKFEQWWKKFRKMMA